MKSPGNLDAGSLPSAGWVKARPVTTTLQQSVPKHPPSRFVGVADDVDCGVSPILPRTGSARDSLSARPVNVSTHNTPPLSSAAPDFAPPADILAAFCAFSPARASRRFSSAAVAFASRRGRLAPCVGAPRHVAFLDYDATEVVAGCPQRCGLPRQRPAPMRPQWRGDASIKPCLCSLAAVWLGAARRHASVRSAARA